MTQRAPLALLHDLAIAVRTPVTVEPSIRGCDAAPVPVQTGYACGPDIPEIRHDAFRYGTARQLIPPGRWGLNDHCFFEDDAGRMHCLAIRTPIRNPRLLHAVADTFYGEFRPRPPIPRPAGTVGMWAPCAIVHDGTVFVFYTNPASLFLGAARPFETRLMTAPSAAPFRWEHHGPVFSGHGEMRDPCVIRDPTSGQFLCFVHRTTATDGRTSAISIRTSENLVDWSETWIDVLVDVPGTLPGGCSESPHVFERNGVWYLLVTHTGRGHYTRTRVYASSSPWWFGHAGEAIGTLWTHAPEVLRVDSDWWITCAGHRVHALMTGQAGFVSPGIAAAALDWGPSANQSSGATAHTDDCTVTV
ncbi:MAG: hypothetical protein D6761_03495 [Candidatus Dadabacteria bacterium]|nr:MAG: hypothetical protein D6761_03495 [Candidatus Dadabacteria bacterium]